MLNSDKFYKLFSLSFKLGIKPVFLYFIFLLNTAFSQQNLVPNGSFEEYWECPTSNDLNNGQFERCKYWWKPTMGTSDYFNSCNNTGVGIPNNFWGYQEAYEGNGYVGMSLISWIINSNNYIGNEYIQTELVDQLKPCVEYNFEMKINFANYSRYSFSKIGALFTQSNIQQNTSLPITLTPQIINSQGFLVDTSNWETISGNFIASGGEKYLTIGYFFDNVENDTLNFQMPISFDEEGYGYYYIDFVSLIEVGVVANCEQEISNVFTPNNDGVNDYWEFNSFIEGEVIILNRWGEVVYSSIGTEFSWGGEKYSSGVYFFKFISEKNIKTGFIHLIR